MKPTTCQVAFATGTGRCGTLLLHRLMNQNAGVASSHERLVDVQTFHRFFKWNDLPVDHEGFLHSIEMGVQKDHLTARLSFESSAYLAFSIRELFERFKPKFVFLVRNPRDVVNSYFTKGYYRYDCRKLDHSLPPSMQIGFSKMYHFMNRFTPHGDEFAVWSNLTRIGKISWYWSAVNKRIFQLLANIPRDQWILQKVEELNYESY